MDQKSKKDVGKRTTGEAAEHQKDQPERQRKPDEPGAEGLRTARADEDTYD